MEQKPKDRSKNNEPNPKHKFYLPRVQPSESGRKPPAIKDETQPSQSTSEG